MKIARFWDNMREVAVTEGDKVAAQIKFGFSVNSYGIGDLVQCIEDIAEEQIDKLVSEYADLYELSPGTRAGGELHQNIIYQARL
jgi:L-arabinose isomerase